MFIESSANHITATVAANEIELDCICFPATRAGFGKRTQPDKRVSDFD
jgi:hypothetical protein